MASGIWEQMVLFARSEWGGKWWRKNGRVVLELGGECRGVRLKLEGGGRQNWKLFLCLQHGALSCIVFILVAEFSDTQPFFVLTQYQCLNEGVKSL